MVCLTPNVIWLRPKAAPRYQAHCECVPLALPVLCSANVQLSSFLREFLGVESAKSNQSRLCGSSVVCGNDLFAFIRGSLGCHWLASALLEQLLLFLSDLPLSIIRRRPMNFDMAVLAHVLAG